MRRALFALALLSCLPAQAGETEAQRYSAAGETFKTLKAEALKGGDMPRMADPKARETLDILANRSGSFGAEAFPAQDLGTVMGACDIANRASADYRMFGLVAFMREKREKGLLPPQPDPKTVNALVMELTLRNIVRFQDEVMPLFDFGERCMASALPLLADFVAKLPPEQMTDIRRQGLAKLRAGVRQSMVGAIGTVNYEPLREENRRRFLDAAVRDVPALSAALPVAERAQMRAEIEKVRGGAPQAYQGKIDAMLKTLDDARCEGLCRY